MSNAARFRRLTVAAFKRHGQLSLDVEGVRIVCATLESIVAARFESGEDTNDAELQRQLDAIITACKDKGLTSSIVPAALLQSAINELTARAQLAVDEESFGGPSVSDLSVAPFKVIDSFSADLRCFRYNHVRKCFVDGPASLVSGKVPAPTLQLNGTAQQKRDLWVRRFDLLKQRTLRNPYFAPPATTYNMPSLGNRQKFTLTALESLFGSAPGTQLCIMGMLCQMEDNQFCIEDPQGSVKVDLSHAVLVTGLFTENSIVIAEGVMDDRTFVVTTLGFPPVESRVDTMLAHPVLQPYNESERKQLATVAGVPHIKQSMIAILSDVNLDKPRVFEKLHALFTGFAGTDQPPAVFVLMGNFTSHPMGAGSEDHYKLRELFDRLADLIQSIDVINKNCEFVFVPGPHDLTAGSMHCLPRPPLLQSVTQRLRERVHRATFASNPARLRYFGTETVLFRADILQKMRRNCILPHSEHETPTLSHHLVKTLLDQSHLCPLPLPICPIYWSHDHSLSLYPSPDALVLADCVDQYRTNYNQCEAMNPGSFATDGSFIIYRPLMRETEFSAVQLESSDIVEGDVTATTVQAAAQALAARDKAARRKLASEKRANQGDDDDDVMEVDGDGEPVAAKSTKAVEPKAAAKPKTAKQNAKNKAPVDERGSLTSFFKPGAAPVSTSAPKPIVQPKAAAKPAPAAAKPKRSDDASDEEALQAMLNGADDEEAILSRVGARAIENDTKTGARAAATTSMMDRFMFRPAAAPASAVPIQIDDEVVDIRDDSDDEPIEAESIEESDNEAVAVESEDEPSNEDFPLPAPLQAFQATDEELLSQQSNSAAAPVNESKRIKSKPSKQSSEELEESSAAAALYRVDELGVVMEAQSEEEEIDEDEAEFDD